MVNKALAQKLAKNQVLRFVFSAGIGFLVDVSAFYLFYHNLLTEHTYQLMSYTLRNSTISLSISFFMGVVVNFLITRYFVFNESQTKPSKQFFRFILVAVVGFFANLAVVDLLIRYFGVYPPLARIMAALSLFFASFFIHKLFSFSLSLRHHAT
ncbi:MAG: GtrA family protein [Mucilaginibacter sp.]